MEQIRVRMNIRPLFEIVLLHALVVLVLTVKTDNSFADEVKIGAILHLTGDTAMQSAAFLEGIQIAVEQANKTRTSTAPVIKLVIEDGHNKANMSHGAASKLLHKDNVSAAIISSNLDAMAAGPLFEKAKVPAIVLWDSSPEIDDLGDYIFSIGPWIPSSGEAAADFASSKIKAKTALILKSQDPFSDLAEVSFRTRFEKLGGKVQQTFSINPDSKDFRSLLVKMSSLQPDVVYSPVVYNLIPLYSQIKQLNFNAPIISCNIISDEHLRQAPQAFEGIYHTMIRDPDSKTYEKLHGLYLQKFKKPITLKWFVAVGYDAANMLIHSLSINKASPSEIKKELYQISDFKGATGTITINARGSAPQLESLYQIRKGKFVAVE